LHRAAQRVAERENCSLNQLINLALAEKIAVLDAGYWSDRKKAAAKKPPVDVLKRLAGNVPPRRAMNSRLERVPVKCPAYAER